MKYLVVYNDLFTELNESVELAEGELAYIRNASEGENSILHLYNIGEKIKKMLYLFGIKW